MAQKNETTPNPAWDAHTTSLFYDLKILKLKDMYTFQIAKIMHQYSSNSYKGKYDITSVKNVHNYPTRFAESLNFYEQPSTLKSTNRALSVAGPKVWAQIPKEIKTLPFNTFKVVYKNFLLEKYCEKSLVPLSRVC